jgi:hypothetical protein
MSDRPKIPIPVKRAVLTESCHRCAVCGFGLSIELAHIIPWFETHDHRPENLIALITAMFKDDAQLFKQFQDNESFRRWLTDTIFGMTYED